MGSGIAAVLANAGDSRAAARHRAQGRQGPQHARQAAIEKQKKGATPGYAHPKFAKLVTPGNLEDDLDKLADVDWIIEVVLEKLEVKHDVYKKIDPKRKKGSIVSSNTSTIPLHSLLEGMPGDLPQDFLITHFFNPPRFMKLLEVVKSPKFEPARFAAFCDFADRALGKGRRARQGHAGLPRQPHRRVLDDGGARRGDEAPHHRRGRRRGDGQAARHSQDRHVRAVRPHRHRPHAADRRRDAEQPAEGRRLPRALQAAGPREENDRRRLYRPQGQGRLLPPRHRRQGEEEKGSARPQDRRIPAGEENRSSKASPPPRTAPPRCSPRRTSARSTPPR